MHLTGKISSKFIRYEHNQMVRPNKLYNARKPRF